jgi:hypothetical protein
MMLGEPSDSADYWKKAGDEALAHKFKGVIMMVSKSWLLISRLRGMRVGVMGLLADHTVRALIGML